MSPLTLLKLILIAVTALLLIALGIFIGYKLWHHEPRATQETFKPGRVQQDGSVSLTRIPTAPADAGPAPHQIPKGATETARVHLKVKPKPQSQSVDLADSHPSPACSCEPFDLDLSLVQSDDGSGIIASADNAEIDLAHSTYTPMQDLSPPQYRNFAHITNEPGTDNYTGTIGKRFLGGRVGLGIGGIKREGDTAGALLEIEFNW